MTLAWFSPWPPDPSGIADRSAELVPVLAGRGHGVDVFVDAGRVPVPKRHEPTPPAAGDVRVMSAHDFVWRMVTRPYDLVVYQVGNSHLHEFIWPYLFRWPGLSVLHDGRLHHARALALLSSGRVEAYRAEFAWNHPGVPLAAAELVISGFDGVYASQWPMVRGVIESSRVTAAHARGAGAALAAESARSIEYIALGGGLQRPVPEAARRARRASAGIPDQAVVFGAFGGLTTEKRIRQIVRAFAAVHPGHPDTRLVLAGRPDPALDLDGLVQGLGVAAVTTMLGRLDQPAFDEWIAAADVSLNLRWPGTLETSGPWLRALSAGRPTVIIDLEHHADVPALDPRTWQPHAHAGADRRPAAAVAIDILDEDHSLRAAMRRLAADPALRDRLGRAARTFWEEEHTVARMADDYGRVMARALTVQAAAPGGRPPHLAPDAWAHTQALAAPFVGTLSSGLEPLTGPAPPHGGSVSSDTSTR